MIARAVVGGRSSAELGLSAASPRIVAASTLVSLVVVLGLFGWFAWRDRLDTEREARATMLNLANVLAEHASRLFETADLVLRRAVEIAGPPGTPLPRDRATHEQLALLARSTPYIASVWIGDAKGNAVATSRQFPALALDASDHAFFRTVRDDPRVRYVGLMPDSRYPNAVLIVTSRRVAPVEGEFRGFAQVAISPEYIRKLYEGFATDLETAFWLLDGELRPLVRQPALPIEQLLALPTQKSFAPIRGRLEGVIVAASPIDGNEQLFAFKRLDSTDAYALVRVATEDITARWRARVLGYSWVGVAALLAIGGLGGLAWQRARQQEDLTELLDRRVRERTQELERALAQKEMLLREVNHRIKNSLQLVSSVLALQRNQLEDEAARAQFAEAASRVRTVARVHERLYRAESIETVEISRYLEELCEELETSLATEAAPRRIRVEADRRELATDAVIPLALIVNELVTNAFKYAYPDDAPGEVLVAFRTGPGDGWRLTVVDTGVGLAPTFDPLAAGGLGMKLVRALARQLSAGLRFEPNEPGTRVVVETPAPTEAPATTK